MMDSEFEPLLVSFALGLLWGVGSTALIIQNFYKQVRNIGIKQENPIYYPKK